MRQYAITTIVLFGLSTILCLGCDLISGNSTNDAPPPPVAVAPPVAPVPSAPIQPAVAPQPIPAPTQPAAATPSPVQPVPAPAQPAVATPTPTPEQPVPAPAQPPVAIPVPAPEQPVPAPKLAEATPETDILADKMTAKKTEVAAAYTPTSALTKQNLIKGKKQAYQIQLPGPPFCHTFIALTAETTNNVDLLIKSPTGTSDATDSTEDSTATIQDYCPTTPGSYQVTVAMPTSAGEFAVQVFSK